jgi:hypothetical protein
MLTSFIAALSAQLQQENYLSEIDPALPGVPSLLYARSRLPFRLGFARVEDHFLFIDWDNAVFGRQARLLEFYQRFSAFVNRRFPVPHALRLQIPNLVLVALAPAGFPPETIRFARANYLNPWYGGETGQVILVEFEQRQVYTHAEPGSRQPGALPLTHAAGVIRAACERAFRDQQ